MFQKILVPVDLTDKNRLAIETARDLAAQHGGEVILLHVIETLDLPFEEVEDFYQRLEDKARESLKDAAAPLHVGEVPSQQHVVYGKRAPEIVQYAQENAAELIIMSSHAVRPDDEGQARLMTISHQVALFAGCPVLLLR